MTRIVRGVVNNLHMREAYEPYNKHAEHGRYAKGNNLGSGGTECNGCRLGRHIVSFRPQPREHLLHQRVGRSPGLRITRFLPPSQISPVALGSKALRLQLRGQPRNRLSVSPHSLFVPFGHRRYRHYTLIVLEGNPNRRTH
jgi:hypothetical protein